jgi:hypothetical protein
MDAALQINPYYGKTSEAGVLAHLEAGMQYGPAIIYNVPGRTGQLRRGSSVIIPPTFSFVWRIPLVATNESDEWQNTLVQTQARTSRSRR